MGLTIADTVHYRLARRLAEVLQEAWGDNLVSVVLYGSAARGAARRDSDIDVLVIAERLPERWHERLDLFRKTAKALEPELARLRGEGYFIDFSPLVWTRDEAARTSRLYLDMTLEEAILFDREAFFAGVLSRLREGLARLGAVRRQVGQKWYWDLKPNYRYGEIFEGLGDLRQVELSLQTARFARENGYWPFVVRQAQECLELALKAALNFVGVDPPKWHDVGVIVQQERLRFPEWFAKDADLIAYRSRKLADDRERSMYGSEKMALPAHAIFGEVDAREAVTAAEETFTAVKRLVEAGGA